MIRFTRSSELTELFRAIDKRDLSTVRRLIETGEASPRDVLLNSSKRYPNIDEPNDASSESGLERFPALGKDFRKELSALEVSLEDCPHPGFRMQR